MFGFTKSDVLGLGGVFSGLLYYVLTSPEKFALAVGGIIMLYYAIIEKRLSTQKQKMENDKMQMELDALRRARDEAMRKEEEEENKSA